MRLSPTNVKIWFQWHHFVKTYQLIYKEKIEGQNRPGVLTGTVEGGEVKGEGDLEELIRQRPGCILGNGSWCVTDND